MAAQATHQAQYEAIVQRQHDHVRAAVDRGGLPTEDEEQALYKALAKAYDTLEDFGYRIAGIAESGDGHDVAKVTLEDIGVIAVIASDIERAIDDFARELGRIRTAVFSLEAIRQEQTSRKGDEV